MVETTTIEIEIEVPTKLAEKIESGEYREVRPTVDLE
jgi:hypothetical protein